MSDTTSKIMIFTDTKECRACLGKIYGDGNSSDLFHAWDPPWFGMGISIAEDLTKITNVQITPSDSHSKSICTECRDRLQDAISFVSMVQNRDLILRTRQIENETASWPKPIQVDKGQVISTMDLSVQVKQEILSDNECEMLEAYSEQDEPKLEIKIEPEEMTLATHSVPEEMTHSVSQSNLPPTVEVDCPATMLNTAGMTLRPISLESVEDEKIQLAKDEPMSEEDIDSAASDDDSMPNDCMLCMKSFNTVKVLKAHVIAAHSYDTIIASQVYKEKEHVCKTCQQSFCTRTDLYVHETCHSKFECCVCDEKFESFPELTKHRSKQCEQAAVMPRLNTLEDVRRIAGFRGTKSLHLFDFHIPIKRIKEMKMVEKSEKIKAIKREQHNARREQVKGSNGQLANDELHSILDENVTSVIVNLRLPSSECDIVAKIEPLDSDYTNTLLGYFNDTAHIKTEQQTDDELVPKTHPDNFVNTKTVKRSSRKKTRCSIDPATHKLIKNKNILSQPSLLKKLEDLLRSRHTNAELKRKITRTGDIKIEGYSAMPELESDSSKSIKQKRTRRKRQRQTIKTELNPELTGENIKIPKGSLTPSQLKKSIKRETFPLKTQMKEEKMNAVEAKATQQSRAGDRNRKFSSLKACKMKCSKRIPIPFQKKVFEHYNSLSKWDRRRYLSTLVDRIPCSPFKTRFQNKHYMKLGTECYSICKICLSKALNLNSASLSHSERLQKYKTEKPLYLISDKNPSQSENCTMKTDDPDQLIDSKSTEHSHSIKTQITPECSGNEDVKLEKTEHLCDKESNIKKEDIENETKKCLLQPDLPSAKTCDTTNNTCLLTKDIDRDADNQISVGNLPTLHGHELTKKLQDFSDDDNETKTSEDFSVEEQIRSIVGESYIDDSNHDKKAQDLKDKAIKSQELTKSSISGLLSDIKPQEPEQPLEIPQVIDLTKSSISESIFDSKLQEPEQPLDNVSQDNEVTKSSIIESLSDSKNQGHSLTKSEEIKIDYEPDENKFTEDIANERTLTNKPGENIQQ